MCRQKSPSPKAAKSRPPTHAIRLRSQSRLRSTGVALSPSWERLTSSGPPSKYLWYSFGLPLRSRSATDASGRPTGELTQVDALRANRTGSEGAVYEARLGDQGHAEAVLYRSANFPGEVEEVLGASSPVVDEAEGVAG